MPGMEELAALPPKEILDHAYEKIIERRFPLPSGGKGWTSGKTDALLSYPQPFGGSLHGMDGS